MLSVHAVHCELKLNCKFAKLLQILQSCVKIISLWCSEENAKSWKGETIIKAFISNQGDMYTAF